MRLVAVLCVVPVLAAQGVIEGVIADSVNHAGIAGVAVTLYTARGVRYEAATDAAGTFRIAGVAEGEYRANLQRSGYHPFESVELFRDPRTRVIAKDVTRVSFELVPWASLAGRVRDEAGTPIARAKVELRGPSSQPRPREAVSGPDGTFGFTELPPGQYVLMARPAAASKPSNGGDVRTETVATYYPAETDPDRTQPIAVLAGSARADLELRLRTVPVYRVRGVVLDEEGKPAPKIKVKLARVNPVASSVSFNTHGFREFRFNRGVRPEGVEVVTADNGTFEFGSVHQGDWIIQAESEHSYDYQVHRDTQRIAQAEVLVSRGDIDDLEIRINRGFAINATVEWAGDAKPQSANLQPILLQPVDSGRPAAGKNVGDGVRFEPVYPGRYRVVPVFSNSAGFYLASVLAGGRDILGQPIDLNAFTPPLHFVYRSGTGAIKGTIDRQQAGTVIMTPAAGASVDFIRLIESAAGTAFEIPDLSPGDYNLTAFDRVDTGRFSDPAFLSTLTATATRVRVEKNATVSVELRLNRWVE